MPRQRNKPAAAQVQIFSAFEKLSLTSLKNIYESKIKYDTKMTEFRTQFAAIERHNKTLDAEYEATEKRKYSELKSWHRDRIEPIIKKRQALWEQLESRQHSFVGGILRVTRWYPDQGHYRGRKLRLDTERETQKIIEDFELTFFSERLEREMKERDGYRTTEPEVARPVHQPLPRRPSDDLFFLMLGTRLRIDMSKLDVNRIRTLIADRESQRLSEKEKENELRARASENEQETRRQAQRYQRKLIEQIQVFPDCPYCNGPLSKSETHLDHIYPVSKGGQSVGRNLVFVCISCNLEKKNKTLRQFILSTGLDEAGIYKRLEKLGKDF